MRERFDTIEIVDLRGDLRGSRPAGILQDEGVFEIQTGVCIVTAVARGGERAPGAEARVRYADTWRHGRFSEREKLDWLERATEQPAVLNFQTIPAGGLSDFVAGGFEGLDWVALPECFAFRLSGVQTKRDEFVYAATNVAMKERVTKWLAADETAAIAAFRPTAARPFAPAKRVGWQERLVEAAAYRPLDTRARYASNEFIDRPRPALRDRWGSANLCLYALPSGTGAGPTGGRRSRRRSRGPAAPPTAATPSPCGTGAAALPRTT
jgi:hypothetical protein